MTHLTTKQLMQFIDGTLDYASQAQCTSHLAVCERCRKEVELQKLIVRASRHQPLAKTSSALVRRVMTRVVPEHEKSWKSRVVDNLGNVFAMAMVLTILGYAIMNPGLFKVQQESSRQSLVPQSVTALYAKITQAVSEQASVATKQVVTSTGTESNKIILLTVISLFILVAFDQFVLKRYIGMKMRH